MFFSATNLTGGYGGVNIIEECSFNVDRGEIVSILGPNGAGKSTAMRAMLGILDLKDGNVIIELYPNLSPQSVKRFKTLIQNKKYDGSAFYKVVENTLVQAGDIEFGNIDYLDYSKIGSGKSGLGILKSEISDEYKFIEGSVGLARSTEFDTEDSEFFITLKEIPIYQGEYTPIGKVIYGLDILRKIKIGNKGIYVLRPDYINTFRIFKSN
mgnify:CR=1 FL=1